MNQERIPQIPPEPDTNRPYTPETPPEALNPAIIPETRREILSVLTEGGWQRAKDAVMEYPKYANVFFIRALGEMHDFDPLRFHHEVKIADEDWEHFGNNAWRDKWRIEYAAALKKLNPERFAKEKPIRDEELSDVFRNLSLNAYVNDTVAERDLSLLHALKELAPEEFKKFVESDRFRQHDWPVVKEAVAWLEQHRNVDFPDARTIELVTLRGLLQGMKPEGEQDFTMNQSEWKTVQRELWSTQDRGNAARFFKLANAASRLRVE